MIPVELQTNDGREVIKAEIPPFKMLPEVLIWGNRVFIQHPSNSFTEGFYVYREAFAFTLTTP